MPNSRSRCMIDCNVFPGAGTREEPRGSDTAPGGAEVGPVVQMLSDHACENFGERCGFLAESDTQFL
jgi:hypothetical protein